MVGMLNVNPQDQILEPCGGDGAFVDKLLNVSPHLHISIFELDPFAYNTLQCKYRQFNNIRIKKSDTLLDDELSSLIRGGGVYDKIIGNPPYGAWQDLDKRKRLRKVYSDIYSKESYTLFLYRCIHALKIGGILTFIIPDTFLSLNRHKTIRQFILNNTSIKEILLFPSSFFPGINFGYANLSIITLERKHNQMDNLNNLFCIKHGFKNTNDITSDAYISHFYRQRDILNNMDYSFSIGNDVITRVVNDKNVTRIGDIADCVTGFYSGNDKTYLKAANVNIRNAGKYEIIDTDCMATSMTQDEQKTGISAKAHYIPFVKGGNRRYLKPDEWYMNWSSSAIEEYKNSKKCRFQNAGYYFKKGGIGIPMVRSSKLTAALIEERLFDQSIVGVFPHNPEWLSYLLAFFNSNTCTKLISTINPSTNNSANYIKKIPFIMPAKEQMLHVTDIVNEIVMNIKENNSYPMALEQEINDCIMRIYGF
jgi:hypothetical protein